MNLENLDVEMYPGAVRASVNFIGENSKYYIFSTTCPTNGDGRLAVCKSSAVLTYDEKAITHRNNYKSPRVVFVAGKFRDEMVEVTA